MVGCEERGMGELRHLSDCIVDLIGIPGQVWKGGGVVLSLQMLELGVCEGEIHYRRFFDRQVIDCV